MTGSQNQPSPEDRKALTALKGRLTRLENLVHKGHKLETVFQSVTKMTIAEARELLQLPADRELTLADLTAGITWKLRMLEERVDIQERRFGKLLRHLGLSEDENGEFVSKALIPALKAGAVGDDKSFYGHLLKGGKSHDEIVQMFRIVTVTSEKEGIPNKVLFNELAKMADARLKDLEKTVAEHDEGITTLRKDVDLLEGSHRELRDQVTTVRESVETMQHDSFPFIGILVGCVLGFLVFLWVFFAKFGVSHTGQPSVQRSNHTVTTTTHTNSVLPWFPQWAIALGLGVATALVIIGVVMLFAGGKTKTESKSESTTTSSTRTKPSLRESARSGFRAGRQRVRENRQANREARRQQAEQERQQGSRLLGGVNPDDPRDGETQVLHAAGEGNNHERQKVGKP